MGKCDEFAPLYGAYIYGDTTEEETRKIRSHLTECEKCRADLESREQVLRAVPNVMPRLSQEDRQRIIWSVKAEVCKESKKHTFRQKTIQVIHSLSAAVAVLVIFMGGTIFGLNLREHVTKTSVPLPEKEQPTIEKQTPKPAPQQDFIKEPAVSVTVQQQPSPAETFTRPSSRTRPSRSHVASRFEDPDISWRLLEWYTSNLADPRTIIEDDNQALNEESTAFQYEPLEVNAQDETAPQEPETPLLAVPDEMEMEPPVPAIPETLNESNVIRPDETGDSE